MSKFVERKMRAKVVWVDFKMYADIKKSMQKNSQTGMSLVISSPNIKEERLFTDLNLAMKHFKSVKPPVSISYKSPPQMEEERVKFMELVK